MGIFWKEMGLGLEKKTKFACFAMEIKDFVGCNKEVGMLVANNRREAIEDEIFLKTANFTPKNQSLLQESAAKLIAKPNKKIVTKNSIEMGFSH